jgi:hypothetical protein
MFRTILAAVFPAHQFLRKELKGISECADTRSLSEIANCVINNRLSKIEGLRAQSRSCFLGRRTLKTVPEGDDGDFARWNDNMRSPITRLSTQQSVVIGESTTFDPILADSHVCLTSGANM